VTAQGQCIGHKAQQTLTLPDWELAFKLRVLCYSYANARTDFLLNLAGFMFSYFFYTTNTLCTKKGPLLKVDLASWSKGTLFLNDPPQALKFPLILSALGE